MAKLEAAIAARQQEEEEAKLKRDQEKEATIRLQQKDKVRSPSHINSCASFLLQHVLYAYGCRRDWAVFYRGMENSC